LPGTGTIINDTTIEFQSVALGNSQQCEAVLMGLRVIDSNGDTITISDTVARLAITTIALPPSFVDFSAFDSDYSCKMHDTLTATFSQKLDSAKSPSGQIVSIVVPNISVSGDSLIETDSSVTCTTWLDTHDSTKVHIVPNSPFVLAQMYRVAIKLSGLTGDTTQDFAEGFVCQKSWRLNIVAAPTDGLTCMPTVHFWPPINENYILQYDTTTHDTTAVLDTNDIGKELNAGDTVTYTAPSQVAGAVFKQWSGSGNQAIDTSTNPVLTVTETADQLHSLNIIALYEPVAVDTVCIATAGTNNPTHNQNFVAVQSDSEDCPLPTLNDTCASTTSVNYLLERGKLLTLTAFSTSDTIQFDHWESTDSNINGSKSPVALMVTYGNVCATAHFVGTGGGGGGAQYHLKVFILGVPNDPASISSIATINGPGNLVQVAPNEWDLNTAAPDCIDPELQILNGAYGLEQVEELPYSPSSGYDIETGVLAYGKHTEDLFLNFAGDGTYDIPETVTIPYDNNNQACSSSPTTYVFFYLVKLYPVLTVNIAMDDATIPPVNTLFTPSYVPKPISALGPVWVYDNQDPSSYLVAGPEQVTYSCSVGANYTVNNAYQYQLSYPKSSTNPVILSLTAGTASCYSFFYWGQGCPDEISPNSNTTNPFTGIVMNQDHTVTAMFHDRPFELDKITFYQWQKRLIDTRLSPKDVTNPNQDPGGGDPNGAPVWQPFYTSYWGSGVVKFGLWGGTGTTWAQGSPATIQLKFSKPIDPNNFLGCKLVYISGQYGSTTQGWPFRLGQNATIDPYDGSIVTLTLTDALTRTIDSWKGEEFELIVQDDQHQPIHDKWGEPLSQCNSPSGGEYYISTENPDIQWYYTKTHVNDIHTSLCPGWTACDGSVFTYWMAYYDGNQTWKANSTSVNDGIDANTDVSASDIAFNCDVDNDGDAGSGHVDDASTGANENELMADCPHVWNNFVAAGAVNRLDADKYDFMNLFTDDYGHCGYGQMWIADIGSGLCQYCEGWGILQAVQNMAANPANYTEYSGQHAELPCVNWSQTDTRWSQLGHLIVQPYAETWASEPENNTAYVPPSQRHLNCIADFWANWRAPYWWGASRIDPSGPNYDDPGGGSRIDIQVTIK